MLKLLFWSFNTYHNYFNTCWNCFFGRSIHTLIIFNTYSLWHFLPKITQQKIKSIQAHSLIGCLSNVSKKNNSTIVKLFACFFKFIKVNNIFKYLINIDLFYFSLSWIKYFSQINTFGNSIFSYLLCSGLKQVSVFFRSRF